MHIWYSNRTSHSRALSHSHTHTHTLHDVPASQSQHQHASTSPTFLMLISALLVKLSPAESQRTGQLGRAVTCIAPKAPVPQESRSTSTPAPGSEFSSSRSPSTTSRRSPHPHRTCSPCTPCPPPWRQHPRLWPAPARRNRPWPVPRLPSGSGIQPCCA